MSDSSHFVKIQFYCSFKESESLSNVVNWLNSVFTNSINDTAEPSIIRNDEYHYEVAAICENISGCEPVT